MENQRKIKSFAKILYVLAIIARVCLYIAGVLLVLLAIIIPIFFSKVKMEKDKISIEGFADAKVEMFKDQQKELNIILNDKKVDVEKEFSDTERLGIELVFDMLADTTKEAVVVYIEACIVFSIASMVMMVLAVKNFEKLSKNLKDEDDIFMLDNSKYLRNMAKFLLISYIITLVSSGAIGGALNDSFKTNINTVGVVEVLSLYLLSYIFAYGNSLELKKQEVIEVAESKPKTTRKRKPKKVEEK